MHEQAADLRAAVNRLAGRLRAERRADALSGNKISVLGYLARHGASTPGEIAAAEHQHPQSLTRTFRELQTAGFVDRRPSTEDRRESLLSLTAAGRAAFDRDMADRDAWLAAALRDMPDTEVAVLTIAAKIMDRVADASAQESTGRDKRS